MISIEEVKKLALLAQLEFNDNKINDLAKELNNIIVMISSVNEIDCSDIIPLKSVNDMNQRYKSDEVTSYDISTQLFANAPGQNGNLAKEIKCFIVPKVVE